MALYLLLLTLSSLFYSFDTANHDCTGSGCSGQTLTCASNEATCVITCGGTNGCTDTTFIIDLYSSNLGAFADIKCNTQSSCNGIQIHSARAINMECNGDKSCNNGYVNVTHNDRNSAHTTESFLTLSGRNNTNFTYLCHGQGIATCFIQCTSSIYPSGDTLLCSNGLLDCELQQSTCYWDCIDDTYDSCYGNTINCLTSDDAGRCYTQNAKHFQVNPIYSLSSNPTGSPTPEPTSDNTPMPTTPAPQPTHQSFNHIHTLNLSLLMQTTNYTSYNIKYTQHGQELLFKILNDTRIGLYLSVFFVPENATATVISPTIDNMDIYNQYFIYPGHCSIFDNITTLNNIIFNCEINTDNETLLYQINDKLTDSGIRVAVENHINGGLDNWLSSDSYYWTTNIGFIGDESTPNIQFFYNPINISTEEPTPMPSVQPTKSPSNSDAPTQSPVIIIDPTSLPTNAPDPDTEVDTTTSTVQPDTTKSNMVSNAPIVDGSDDNTTLYILVGVASVFVTLVIVGVLYCIRRKQRANSAKDGLYRLNANKSGGLAENNKLSVQSNSDNQRNSDARSSLHGEKQILSDSLVPDAGYGLNKHVSHPPGYQVDMDGNQFGKQSINLDPDLAQQMQEEMQETNITAGLDLLVNNPQMLVNPNPNINPNLHQNQNQNPNPNPNPPNPQINMIELVNADLPPQPDIKPPGQLTPGHDEEIIDSDEEQEYKQNNNNVYQPPSAANMYVTNNYNQVGFNDNAMTPVANDADMSGPLPPSFDNAGQSYGALPASMNHNDPDVLRYNSNADVGVANQINMNMSMSHGETFENNGGNIL